MPRAKAKEGTGPHHKGAGRGTAKENTGPSHNGAGRGTVRRADRSANKRPGSEKSGVVEDSPPAHGAGKVQKGTDSPSKVTKGQNSRGDETLTESGSSQGVRKSQPQKVGTQPRWEEEASTTPKPSRGDARLTEGEKPEAMSGTPRPMSGDQGASAAVIGGTNEPRILVSRLREALIEVAQMPPLSGPTKAILPAVRNIRRYNGTTDVERFLQTMDKAFQIDMLWDMEAQALEILKKLEGQAHSIVRFHCKQMGVIRPQLHWLQMILREAYAGRTAQQRDILIIKEVHDESEPESPGITEEAPQLNTTKETDTEVLVEITPPKKEADQNWSEEARTPTGRAKAEAQREGEGSLCALEDWLMSLAKEEEEAPQWGSMYKDVPELEPVTPPRVEEPVEEVLPPGWKCVEVNLPVRSPKKDKKKCWICECPNFHTGRHPKMDDHRRKAHGKRRGGTQDESGKAARPPTRCERCRCPNVRTGCHPIEDEPAEEVWPDEEVVVDESGEKARQEALNKAIRDKIGELEIRQLVLSAEGWDNNPPPARRRGQENLEMRDRCCHCSARVSHNETNCWRKPGAQSGARPSVRDSERVPDWVSDEDSDVEEEESTPDVTKPKIMGQVTYERATAYFDDLIIHNIGPEAQGNEPEGNDGQIVPIVGTHVHEWFDLARSPATHRLLAEQLAVVEVHEQPEIPDPEKTGKGTSEEGEATGRKPAPDANEPPSEMKESVDGKITKDAEQENGQTVHNDPELPRTTGTNGPDGTTPEENSKGEPESQERHRNPEESQEVVGDETPKTPNGEEKATESGQLHPEMAKEPIRLEIPEPQWEEKVEQIKQEWKNEFRRMQIRRRIKELEPSPTKGKVPTSPSKKEGEGKTGRKVITVIPVTVVPRTLGISKDFNPANHQTIGVIVSQTEDDGTNPEVSCECTEKGAGDKPRSKEWIEIQEAIRIYREMLFVGLTAPLTSYPALSQILWADRPQPRITWPRSKTDEGPDWGWQDSQCWGARIEVIRSLLQERGIVSVKLSDEETSSATDDLWRSDC